MRLGDLPVYDHEHNGEWGNELARTFNSILAWSVTEHRPEVAVWIQNIAIEMNIAERRPGAPPRPLGAAPAPTGQDRSH